MPTVSDRFIPARAIRAVTGLDARAVDKLIRNGVVDLPRVGHGFERQFTADEAVRLAVVARLASVGVRPSDIKIVLPLIKGWPDRVIGDAPEGERVETDPVVVIAASAIGHRVVHVDTIAKLGGLLNAAEAFTLLKLGNLVRSVLAELARIGRDETGDT